MLTFIMLHTFSSALGHCISIYLNSVLCHLPQSSVRISAPLHTPLPNTITSKRIVAVGMVTGYVSVNVPGF